MRERPTVRVLLLGPDNRLLLIRFEDKRLNKGRVFWATVGGGLENGEDVLTGARREIAEETGITDAELGPVVWLDDVVIDIAGESVFFREQYIVARTARTDFDFSGWTELEREVIKDIRWFTVDDIRASTERIYPDVLADWLPDILGGIFPPEPKWIPRA
ncbi:MAG: NUDIX domain-containing protein [Alphaproteobacteria bacterium]|nr:NUDIX domain-containing protein [Alphaproteobacteria bacterium]